MHIYYINGQYKHKEESFISVEDRGFNFSDGVYEVVSFDNFNIINKEKHFLRLKRSLSELKIENPFYNFKSLEIILKRLMKINKQNNGFIYLQITRGTSPRNHQFPKKSNPNIVIFCFPKKDFNLLRNGVSIGLSKDLRWNRCDIKSISLLPNLLEKQKAVELGYYEIWQTRENFVTEGSTSNAFIVNSDKTILTHPSNNLILGGVTRDCVIEIALKNKIPIKEKAFTIKDLNGCNEAFLSSTTAGVLPVIKVNNKVIKEGKTGEITKKLMKLYKNFITDQLNE